MFKPKLFTVLSHYSKPQLLKDITAGIIVGIIAIPLSLALSIASGMSPEKGLHTAIIAGFLISFFGGSRVQIGGPTGAFVIIVYRIIEKHGISGLIISTIMAGIILIFMGLLRFGSIIKFIPHPITTGFTSGIAITIALTQLKDFFGFQIESLPSDFIEKIKAYIAHINTINLSSFLLGLLSIAIIIIWPRIPKIGQKLPGSIIAILTITSITLIFKIDVETIGARFGEISSALPIPTIPVLDLNTISTLIQPAFTIAILAGIESLLSAVVADGMIGGRHRSNMELVAQGIANIASGLFGGLPATGAIARTATNVKNGGSTPIAGIVHSATVLVITLLFMPYAKHIPLCCLAAILLVVAYNMNEWNSIIQLIKAPKSDITVLLVTFLLTVVFDLVIAIEFGVVLAAILFMKRMSDVTQINSITEELSDLPDPPDSTLRLNKVIPKHILIYEINGPFFFGAAEKFVSVIDQIQDTPKILILVMKSVPTIDATGFHALYSLYKKCMKQGTQLHLTNVQEQPLKALIKYEFVNTLGDKHFHEDINAALINTKDV